MQMKVNLELAKIEKFSETTLINWWKVPLWWVSRCELVSGIFMSEESSGMRPID
jgi:hypothetical protein